MGCARCSTWRARSIRKQRPTAILAARKRNSPGNVPTRRRCSRRNPRQREPRKENRSMSAAIQYPSDFVVKDLSLAEWGRKEIKIAETEMPGLMAIRHEFAGQQPLRGARVSGSLHMTIQTAVLRS